MTEKEKMIAGKNYNPLDDELVNERERAHDLCHLLRVTRPSDKEAIAEILVSLFRSPCGDIYITPPFFCDYGFNIKLGKGFYCNTDCVMLDCAPINIGENVFLGPNVQIYTPVHPLNADERLRVEFALPVNIGDNVWIGGGAIICPGVTVGARSVIGAGSVVTRNIPADSLAVGNPCRVIKEIK